MVHADSKRLIFNSFLSLSLLVGSMAYGIDRSALEWKNLLAASALASSVEFGVNRFIFHNPPETFPLVGYDYNIAPVASKLQNIKTLADGRSTPEDEDIDVVSATEARYGLRLGYFTFGVKIPKEGTFAEKLMHLHPHIDGFTFSHVVKTIAASYALQAGLQVCATKFGSTRK